MRTMPAQPGPPVDRKSAPCSRERELEEGNVITLSRATLVRWLVFKNCSGTYVLLCVPLVPRVGSHPHLVQSSYKPLHGVIGYMEADTKKMKRSISVLFCSGLCCFVSFSTSFSTSRHRGDKYFCIMIMSCHTCAVPDPFLSQSTNRVQPFTLRSTLFHLPRSTHTPGH